MQKQSVKTHLEKKRFISKLNSKKTAAAILNYHASLSLNEISVLPQAGVNTLNEAKRFE